jgi:hypothetical protein
MQRGGLKNFSRGETDVFIDVSLVNNKYFHQRKSDAGDPGIEQKSFSVRNNIYFFEDDEIFQSFFGEGVNYQK